MPTTADTDTAVLSSVASHLAVRLSDLTTEFGQQDIPPNTVKKVLDTLADRQLVRAEPVGSEEVIYRITADGMMELERSSKRNLFGLFRS